MNYTICYISKAISTLNKETLNAIFNTTENNNRAQGIYGILLFGMGDFFQVLEGDKDQLLLLYDKIKEDPRHENIYEVMNKATENAIFSDYNSDFQIVHNSKELEDIKQYLKSHEYSSTSNKIQRLLRPFILDQ